MDLHGYSMNNPKIARAKYDKSQEIKFILKFIYSEKATNFCEISTSLLSVSTVDKSKVEILQNCVAFSEYTNFN